MALQFALIKQILHRGHPCYSPSPQSWVWRPIIRCWPSRLPAQHGRPQDPVGCHGSTGSYVGGERVERCVSTPSATNGSVAKSHGLWGCYAIHCITQSITCESPNIIRAACRMVVEDLLGAKQFHKVKISRRACGKRPKTRPS